MSGIVPGDKVERVFKRFSSLAQLGHLPTYDTEGAKAWLCGKLLVEKLISHAVTVFALGDTAWRWYRPRSAWREFKFMSQPSDASYRTLSAVSAGDCRMERHLESAGRATSPPLVPTRGTLHMPP